MKNSLLTFFALMMTLTGFTARAHDGAIVGEGLKLNWIDHSLVGTIDGLPVFADSLTDQFGIRLSIRVEGQTFSSVLKKQDNLIQGELLTTRATGEARTMFVINSIDAEAGKITGQLDEDVFSIQITSEEMDGHHYVNPVYTVKIGDKQYVYKMEDGSACIGCSAKIAFAILSAKRNAGLW